MVKVNFMGLVWANLLLICTFSQVYCSGEADIQNIYGFNATDIDGNEVSFEKYRGHVLLVVNVASECTLTTSNYQQLNELYSKYEKAGLRIAAFPSNDFNQEPGDRAAIKQFVTGKNVKFDVYDKVSVNGDDTIPLYRWLKNKQTGIFGTTGIKWNFTKFLVNKQGIPVDRFSPTTSPSSIERDIKALLEA